MTDNGSRGARPPGAAHWACGCRGSRVASPEEEVAADRVGARIGVDPRAGTEMLGQLGAGPGPATMLMATAWSATGARALPVRFDLPDTLDGFKIVRPTCGIQLAGVGMW